jgi:hypothetical protein
MTFGDPRETWKWSQGDPDYVQLFDLSEQDIPQLLTEARQWIERQDWPDDQEDLTIYAPVHAWRALAQLKAIDVVPDLLDMMVVMDEQDDDWHLQEFPDVFGMIGPEVIPALVTLLNNDTQGDFSRSCVAHGLCEIAKRHPTTRGRVIEALNSPLNQSINNTEMLNAFIVGYLLDLQAAESAEVIERAYAADRVDTTVVGNWNTVRDELGVEGLGLVPEKLAGQQVNLFNWTPAHRDTQVHHGIEIRTTSKHKRKKRKIERQNRKRARQRRR